MSAMYVILDKTEHILGGDEHTRCGLLVPQASTWTKEPTGKVCALCTKAEERAAEQADGTPA